MTGYNDGVCEGNAQLGEKVLWKTLQFEWMFSLWNVSISIVAVQFKLPCRQQREKKTVLNNPHQNIGSEVNLYRVIVT